MLYSSPKHLPRRQLLNGLLVKRQLASCYPRKSSKHFKWCLATWSHSHSGIQRPWLAPYTEWQKRKPTCDEQRFPSEQENAVWVGTHAKKALVRTGASVLRVLCVHSMNGFLLTGFIIAHASREILHASAVKVLTWHPFHIRPY